jgi:thioredoxin-dependent peroxiredoxin
MSLLAAGSPAPAFSAPNEKGETTSLADYEGKKLILFFYPAANTPSCTAENCSLRDGYAALQAKGYELLGVSPDKGKKLQSFIAKNNLPFHLLSDPDNAVTKIFGAWGEKMMYGKTYEGLLRSTFIIDEKGVIERVIDKVDTKNHAQQILEG